jgi:hypothetical protein
LFKDILNSSIALHDLAPPLTNYRSVYRRHEKIPESLNVILVLQHNKTPWGANMIYYMTTFSNSRLGDIIRFQIPVEKRSLVLGLIFDFGRLIDASAHIYCNDQLRHSLL